MFVLTQEKLKKAVKALRSKRYKQGRGCLLSDNKYCCLGVMAKVWRLGKFSQFPRNGKNYLNYNGMTDSFTLPYEVADQFWTYGFNCSDLAEMNDNGESFEYIADYIEDKINGR